MNKGQLANEIRQVLRYFVATLDSETQSEMVMEVATVYPKYEVGKAYKTKDIFKYGKNSVGDPQLYQVLQDHTSQENWTPDTAFSLYKAIGISDSGYPIWVQPLCAEDAYNKGDIVMHNDVLYISTIDSNVWAPDAYPAGWDVYDG